MAKPPWRERLRDELRKRGLPPDYANRLVQELTDHSDDIQRGDPSMNPQESAEEKLGSPERLAAAAEQEFGRRTFAGRHPFLTFAVSPLSATIAVCAAIALIGKGLARLMLLPVTGMHPLTISQTILGFIEGYLLCLTPFVLGWLFLELSRRAGRPVWGLFACGLLAFVSLNLRPVIGADFDLSFSFGSFLRPDRMVQSVLPLTLALWAWWRIHYPPTNPLLHPGAAPTPSPSSDPVRA